MNEVTWSVPELRFKLLQSSQIFRDISKTFTNLSKLECYNFTEKIGLRLHSLFSNFRNFRAPSRVAWNFSSRRASSAAYVRRRSRLRCRSRPSARRSWKKALDWIVPYLQSIWKGFMCVQLIHIYIHTVHMTPLTLGHIFNSNIFCIYIYIGTIICIWGQPSSSMRGWKEMAFPLLLASVMQL